MVHDPKLRAFQVAAGMLAVALLLARWLPRAYWPESGGYALLQVLCSLVALAVCAVGVRAYAQAGSPRLLLMGLGFLAFAVLDFLHSWAAPGEPAFIVAADENLSLWFWQL